MLLQPYARNLTSATVKSPKLYWMDLGLLRHGTRAWGELTGPLFETLVVSEARKWIDTVGRDVSLWVLPHALGTRGRPCSSPRLPG